MSSLCSPVEAGKRLIAVLAVSSPGNDKQFGETPLSQIESLQTNCNCQIAQFLTIRLFYPGAKKPTKTLFPLTGKTEKKSFGHWNCHAGPSFLTLYRRLTSSSDAGCCVWHGMCIACYLIIQPCKKSYKGVTRCKKLYKSVNACKKLYKTGEDTSFLLRQDALSFTTESRVQDWSHTGWFI